MALRPIYYDTETTGLRSEKDRIIELAAYDPVNDKSFDQLINPEIPIPAEATAISKITNEMVAEKPTFSEIVADFTAFCEGDVVLIAHNNDSFDINFMRAEFGRCGLELPSWQFLDTLKWARRYRPDLPRHTLQFLRELYGIPANNAHRALDDVMVLYRLFSLMIDDLPIETVVNLMKVSKGVSRMPFGKYQGKALEKVPKDYVSWLAQSGALDKPENEDLRKNFVEIGLLVGSR